MLRKIAEIKVPKGAGPREAKTKHIFATYDRQGAAFAFYFSDSSIAGATANLLFMIDGQKVFVDDGVTLSETNETHTFTYPLPDKLLNYTGKVDGYLYFDFEDGSHSDEIHFVFTIKKSQIDEEMEEAPDIYIKSFEDVKERVEQAGDSATKDIEKSKDEAESQIGDYVGEVESAKGSAIEDIDKALPEVEDKLEDIDKALPEVEGKLQDLQKKMIVGGRNYIRNSNMWASKEEKSFEFLPYDTLVPGTYVLSADIEIVNAHPKRGPENSRLGVQFKVLYESEEEIKWLNSFYYPKEGENYKGRIHDVIEIKDTITWTGQRGLFANQIEGDVVRVGLPKLARGNVPTDWSPAIEDYDAKIKRIENAITELGGNI